MKILMVCLGNICRSPLAEGIMKQKVQAHGLDWYVDSAGTAGYHIGQPPDHRSVEVAQKYNIDISGQASRQISEQDLHAFDHILAMDSQNYQDVKRLADESHQVDITLILNYLDPGKNQTVPDPYYGGTQGFERIYQLLDHACDAFIAKNNNQHHFEK